ncbi:MAG TPA: RNA polymerase sigma factor [Anaerolineae bacterium]
METSSALAANFYAEEGLWLQDDPDPGLVAAAQSSPRAFSLLYERYRAPIYRYCYVRLHSGHAAEDATADVFLEAFANRRRYPGGTFLSWLYAIAGHVVAGLCRHPGLDPATAQEAEETPASWPGGVWC